MKLSRRKVLESALLAPALAGPWPMYTQAFAAGTSPHSLALRRRAVLIDGKPVFLVIGTVDYYRCPSEEWRERLLQAKRCGLNTVMFCVPWNFHEREEGVFSFSGDTDLGRYLDLCGELGLYAFPRAGPFICTEWDAAGHPAWLYAKPDIELRIDHAPTLEYVRRWFERVIPIIAQRQVTRGGPVVFVQQENEYYFVGRAGGRNYQNALIDMMRRFGIEVPITDCNGDSPQTRVSGSMMTQNSGGAEAVAKVWKVQPDKPAIITELYTDYSQMWGWPVSSYPTSTMVYQQTVETIAAGGMFSYYMFYGGTNFGFWASTTWKSDESFITTRYYARAPLGEGGAFNESFWAVKAANLLARAAEEYLTAAEVVPVPVSLSGPVRGNALRAPQGYLIFVQPEYPEKVTSVFHTESRGNERIQTAEEWPFAEIAHQAGSMALPGGASVELAETSARSSMLPYQLQIDAGCHIDYANASFFGVAGPASRRVVLLRGETGRKGIVSVNGKRAEFVFSAQEPAQVSLGGVTVMGLSLEQADRTWFADGRVLIGAAYVGEAKGELHECFLDGRSAEIQTISRQGVIESRRFAPAQAASTLIPLQRWAPSAMPEISSSSQGWRALERPVCVEQLGAYWGYSWYRCAIESPVARETGLLFVDASDRLTVFVNGRRAGVWGRGPEAVRDPLRIPLRAGRNELVLLCDNMGRLSEGSDPDRKGIKGPAYVDARVCELPAPSWSVVDAPPTNSWQFQTYREFGAAWSVSTARGSGEQASLHRVSYSLAPEAGTGLKLALLAFPQYAWVLVNGRVIAEHSGDLSLANGVDFSSVVLDPHLTGQPLRLDIVFYGERPTDFDSHLRLYSYPLRGELIDWAFKAWADPVSGGAVVAGDPTCWECRFERPKVPGPLFLYTEGLGKGQVWLNGRALGRYWSIGPQYSLYVPDSWLQDSNRLVVFDEQGHSPERVYLARDVRVPTHSVVI